MTCTLLNTPDDVHKNNDAAIESQSKSKLFEMLPWTMFCSSFARTSGHDSWQVKWNSLGWNAGGAAGDDVGGETNAGDDKNVANN